MLMIWSSRARNRSFDPVVLCFFGRIVPSDAQQNHARRFEGILKMKLQASGAPDPKSLQSKNPFPRKTESPIKVLQVLHGRLMSLDPSTADLKSPLHKRRTRPGTSDR